MLLQGPQIISVPQFDTPKRYWIVPLLDAYTNYYGGPGSIRNSTAGQYLVVGPSEFAASGIISPASIHICEQLCTNYRYMYKLNQTKEIILHIQAPTGTTGTPNWLCLHTAWLLPVAGERRRERPQKVVIFISVQSLSLTKVTESLPTRSQRGW